MLVLSITKKAEKLQEEFLSNAISYIYDIKKSMYVCIFLVLS